MKELLIKLKNFLIEDGRTEGLCVDIYRCDDTKKSITVMAEFFRVNLPKEKYSDPNDLEHINYCWKYRALEPRLKWLDEQINKL